MTALRSRLDHLVVTSPSLTAGSEYVQRALGVALQPGGEHPRMGTHNRLLALGDMRYLEVIAANPDAPPPGQPRWFQLDDPAIHGTPRLATWAVRTNNIHAAAAASPIPLGKVESMSRGRLEWLITVPQDGRLFLHGIAPVLIQWPGDVHPTHTLEPRNCRLRQLRGVNPEAGSINAFLAAIGFQGPVAIVPPSPGQPAPCLEAQIETPTGVRTLGSG